PDEVSGERKVATYRLVARRDWPDLAAFNRFFWMSGEHLREALRRYPTLASKEIRHATGPGGTASTCRALGIEPQIFLSHEDWLKSLARND
ncbi:hypothetical protein EB061_12955, partial [bacterium]|nr:hypothetical protein [bacterium]